jgi:hypothetical protein
METGKFFPSKQNQLKTLKERKVHYWLFWCVYLLVSLHQGTGEPDDLADYVDIFCFRIVGRIFMKRVHFTHLFGQYEYSAPSLKGGVTVCNQITGIPASGQCPMCKILRTGIKKYADGENFDQAEKGRSGQDNKTDVLVRVVNL